MNRQSYIDQEIETLAETRGVSKEDAAQEYVQTSQHSIDLNNLQPQNHLWVDRGAVMSCEFAGHPNHRAFKIVR